MGSFAAEGVRASEVGVDAELGEAGPVLLDGAELDVLVAAHHVGQGRDLGGAVVGVDVQIGGEPLDRGGVVGEQSTLDAADVGVAKGSSFVPRRRFALARAFSATCDFGPKPTFFSRPSARSAGGCRR